MSIIILFYFIVSFLLQFSGSFQLRVRRQLGKSKNVSNEVPTRYNLLPERNACQDHQITRSVRNVHRKK